MDTLDGPRRLTLSEMRASIGGGSSTKVRANGSTKASTPRRGRADVSVLARIASAATRARGTGHNDRGQLRFPSLQRSYAKQRHSQSGERKTYYAAVWRYLQLWGFRLLNDLQRDGYDPPSHEQLAALFEARIRERGHTWHRQDGRGVGLELGTVERLAEDAASAVLRDWSEAWIASRRAAGRTGGQRSRRGPSKATADALAALEALPDGMTHQERADALGVSLSTERRLWTRFQQQSIPDVPEDVPDPPEAAEVPEGLWRSRHADRTPAEARGRAPRRPKRRIYYPGER